MADKIFIQHRFTKKIGEHSLTDALIMPIEEYNALTPEQLEAMKHERFTNWRNAVENPPVQVEAPVEERLASINDQLEQLTQQKQSVLVEAESKGVRIDNADITSVELQEKPKGILESIVDTIRGN